MAALPRARASRRTRRCMGFLLLASALTDDVDATVKKPMGIGILLPVPGMRARPRVGAPGERLAASNERFDRPHTCLLVVPVHRGASTDPHRANGQSHCHTQAGG